MNFLNWLCYTEWQSDFKIAEKYNIEMYWLDMSTLKRCGKVKENIDRYKKIC